MELSRVARWLGAGSGLRVKSHRDPFGACNQVIIWSDKRNTH